MRHRAAFFLLAPALAAADPVAAAGPDRALTWPALHAELAGSAANGAPRWYQVSGPAPARLRSAVSAATTVALPQPGTYVFRLVVGSGAAQASDEVRVTLAAAPALGAGATAVDHLLAAPVPFPRTGTRLLPLNRHDFGIPASIAVPLAKRWGYHWMLGTDEWADARMDDSGWPEHGYAQAWAAEPGAFGVTALYMHAVRATHTTRPAGWPDRAFLCDADGLPIDFDAGAGTLYRLSPLAPDRIFTDAGQAIGATIVQTYTRRGIPISAVADQGEWGLGALGFLWEEWPAGSGSYRPIWQRDPAVIAAAAADPVARGDLDRFASRQAARQNRLVKEAVYAAAGLPDTVPWYGYSGTAFTIDRGRWGGWPAWANYLEDAVPWCAWAGEEFYIQGDGWTGTDGGGTPTDYVHRLLNTASGQIAVQGRSRMVPWISAGGWSPESDPFAYSCPRDRYIGFMKLMWTCGAVGVLQDDYGFDQRIRYNTAIGATPTVQVRSWIDAAHVRALFSHYDDILWDGELVPSTADHPFTADPTAPRKLMAFRPAGDGAAWVVARKAAGADRWLITAFATAGAERTVNVTIPGPGTVAVRARAIGSVHLATRAGDGTVTVQWLDETDAAQPTRLWFGDGPGVLATAPPSGGGDSTPPATPSAPMASSTTSATPTLSGVTEPGAVVRIHDNGGVIGVVTADGTGAWSWTVIPPLAPGGHALAVTATDAAGNASALSPATVVTVPTTTSGGPTPQIGEGGGGGGCGGGMGIALLVGLLALGWQRRR